LIAYQRATRRKGGSTLEDLPRSTVRDLSGKLTFCVGTPGERHSDTPEAKELHPVAIATASGLPNPLR